MAKQKRAKRTSRTRRRTEARRLRRATAREAQENALFEIETFIRDVFSPDSPIDHAAEAILERFDGRPVPAGTFPLFVDGELEERARHIADEMVRQAPGDVSALTFAAGVAYEIDRDADRASRLLDEAIATAANAPTRILLAESLGFVGRVAEGLEMIESLLQAWFPDETTQRVYANLLAEADRRATRAAAAGGEATAGGHAVTGEHAAPGRSRFLPDACPCRSGERWWNCCRLREQQALHRFADRGTYQRIATAVTDFVDRSPEWTRVVGQTVRQALELEGQWDTPAWSEEERATVTAWATEFSWFAGDVMSDDEPDEFSEFSESAELSESAETGEVDEAKFDSPILAFSRDPGTPPEEINAVYLWNEHLTYGLWLVVDCDTGPGCWVADIFTGTPRYISMRPEEKARVVRWSVLLGSILPIDGVWRTGAATEHLHPAEGDMLTELAQDMFGAVERAEATGRKPSSPHTPEFGRQGPHGVASTAEEAAPPNEANIVGKVIAPLMPTLLAAVHFWRAEGAQVVNTDSQPICLVDAYVEVADIDELSDQLLDHPLVDLEEEDDGSVMLWRGRPLTGEEDRAIRDELDGRYRSGSIGVGVEGVPRYWTRARMSVVAEKLYVEVNSRERLAGVLDLLRELGANPVVTHQTSMEPPPDLTLRRGLPIPFDVRNEEELDAWLIEWLDHPMPGIPNRTPARAVKRPENLPVVEAAIRELEHDADLRMKAGLPTPDVDVVREELGMPPSRWLTPFLQMVYLKLSAPVHY